MTSPAASVSPAPAAVTPAKAATPEPAPAPAKAATPEPALAPAKASKYSVGDTVIAQFSEDGVWYVAKIDEIGRAHV